MCSMCKSESLWCLDFSLLVWESHVCCTTYAWLLVTMAMAFRAVNGTDWCVQWKRQKNVQIAHSFFWNTELNERSAPGVFNFKKYWIFFNFCKLQLYSPVLLSIQFRLFDLPKFSILLGPLLDPDNVGALHGDRANHLARIGHFSNILSSAV